MDPKLSNIVIKKFKRLIVVVKQLITGSITSKKNSLKKALLCLEKPYEKLDKFNYMYLGPNSEEEVHKTFCGT